MLPSFHIFPLFIICVACVSGCFITNCPPGGKRSDVEEKTHQCEQCGPPGMGGRCYGPQICCFSQFGCLIGGPSTSVCQQEARSPSLCHNPASSCDGSAETGPINGQCAALGICCTPESCTIDEDCSSNALADGEKGHRIKPGSILMQRLEDTDIPMVHGPVDAWFYRRLIHSKPKLVSGSNGKITFPLDSSSDVIQHGPSSVPIGPPKVLDYF